MTREDIVSTLMTSVATVRFQKKDGTLREMRCTLQQTFLPERTTTESTRKRNDEVIAVWDLEKQSWRSFRVDSIQDVQLEIT